ncbi:MAG: hypothetical protein JWO03_1324 [Bacteroidetes bacterium]|nr:hypothetical protein [Bacteroidota bacterium]
MKKCSFLKLFIILSSLLSTHYTYAQQPAQKGLNVNNKGAEAKSSKGGGVEVHKKQVAAKSSSGKGVEANKKGLDVKGSKGGMTVEKKKLDIHSKKVNVHLGK